MDLRRSVFVYLICYISTTCSNQSYAYRALDGTEHVLMNYRKAFNLSKIYQQYRALMERSGDCAKNVFWQPREAVAIDVPPETRTTNHVNGFFSQLYSLGREAVMALAPEDPDLLLLSRQQQVISQEQAYKEEEESFRQACLDQLRSCRRSAALIPTVEAMITSAIMGGVATMTSLMNGSEGNTSLVMGMGISGASQVIQTGIQGAYTALCPQQKPIHLLEEQFILNQCYIPKELWPRITGSFLSGSLESSFGWGKEESSQFLKFALDFTLFKPKPPISLTEETFSVISAEIERRIDAFFSDYEEGSGKDEIVYIVKINVIRFLHCLIDENAEPKPKYIYFYGSGGIGKTHFVCQLSDWINELVPHAVHFDRKLTVATKGKKTVSEILEGSESIPSTPSILLINLRNQLKANARGSFLFMDEAVWLNENPNTAKRVFNGNMSQLSTNYFGTQEDGSSIIIPVPPMLIFAAANEPIEDPALANRFDMIEFPHPKKELLVRLASEAVRQSQILQQKKIDLTSIDFQSLIDELEITNARDVSKVERAILTKAFGSNCSPKKVRFPY